MKFVVQIDEVTVRKSFEDIQKPLSRAISRTMDLARDEVVRNGRAEIRRGLSGSTKFANALRATRYPEKKDSVDAAVWIYHRIPYSQVFEEGMKIAGKPLMWLALPNVPKKIGSRRMTPKQYVAQIGPLHPIRVPGKRPMLAGYMAAAISKPGKRRTTADSRITIPKLRKGSALAKLGVHRRYSDIGRAGVISVPLFVGIPEVELKARFNLAQVFENAAQRIPINLNAQMARAR